MQTFYIGAAALTLTNIREICSPGNRIELSPEATKKVADCRAYLDNKMAAQDAPVYGINTGFGYLQHIQVAKSDLSALQHNLLLSHACGTGEYVPKEIIKLMLLLKVQSLAYGHSGVTLKTIERLIEYYNNDLLPVIYTQGSLGASGDLAPLAHLALPLIGAGHFWQGDDMVTAEKINTQFGWSPLTLESKEGLALINGTQFMSAYGIHMLLQAQTQADWADAIGALSADGFDCRIDPFLPHSHAIRPHPGQVSVAANISEWLKQSELMSKSGKQTQDPYSFRCMPQVHGASRDAIAYVTTVFEREINSVTDNPNIFPEEDLILSAGNFHGQPLALTLDFLAIALSEFGAISERRTFQLISGQRGLPPFLVKDPGLNSGLMITQYTAASIASENKQLCTPSSVDSIVSSNGQEDHVSMGANGATKCLRVQQNLTRILAIEMITSAQALDMRRPLRSSPRLELLHTDFRKQIAFNEKDRLLADDIRLAVDFLKNTELENFS